MSEKGSKVKRNKTYFYADVYEHSNGSKGIVFIWEDGSKIYWAGGDENRQRYIIEQLIEDYGVEVWTAIYTKYNQALLDIGTKDVPPHWTFPKACLTLVKPRMKSNQEIKKKFIDSL